MLDWDIHKGEKADKNEGVVIICQVNAYVIWSMVT